MNDQAFETTRPPRPPVLAASPKPDQPRRSNEERPAEPPAPGPDQAPHEHPDDPGVHPDGPKRYHDDHAAPARQQLEEGLEQRAGRDVDHGIDHDVERGVLSGEPA